MKKRKIKLTKKTPTHWCMGWSGTVELGFDDGTYLPRAAALIFYPKYFKDGEPILEMLPMDEGDCNVK